MYNVYLINVYRYNSIRLLNESLHNDNFKFSVYTNTFGYYADVYGYHKYNVRQNIKLMRYARKVRAAILPAHIQSVKIITLRTFRLYYSIKHKKKKMVHCSIITSCTPAYNKCYFYGYRQTEFLVREYIVLPRFKITTTPMFKHENYTTGRRCLTVPF